MNMRLALRDTLDGARNYEFWRTFGMNDVRSKYRRSKLGQFWITLSVAIFIFVIGGLFRGVFDINHEEYLRYLAVGYVLWVFMSDIITTGSKAIIGSGSFIAQRNWPKTLFCYRVVYREVIIFLHNAIIVVGIFLWERHWPGVINIFWALFGFLLLVYVSFWLTTILSILTLRYRDIDPIVRSLMRMAFFATPIIWVSRDLGAFGNAIIAVNPFRYYLDIVRQPLLGHGVPIQELKIALLLAFSATLIGLFTLSKTSKKIAFWL